MIGALFALALRQAAAPRRAALLAVIALLPVGLAYLTIALTDSGDPDLIGPVIEGLILYLTLPLVVMVMATAAFGNEVEDRTLLLLTTKPVPRWVIVLAKLLATILVAAPVMVVVSVIVVALDPDGNGATMVAAGVGTLLGVVLYATVFTWAGLLTTRALAYGLVYVLLWEAFITSVLTGTRYVSIRSYAVGTMHGMEPGPFSEELAIGFTVALVGSAVVTTLFFLLSVRRLKTMILQ